MARIASQEGLKPSIIDRLIDPESEGTSWRRGYSVEQMIDSVRKDLEDLLEFASGRSGDPRGVRRGPPVDRRLRPARPGFVSSRRVRRAPRGSVRPSRRRSR